MGPARSGRGDDTYSAGGVSGIQPSSVDERAATPWATERFGAHRDDFEKDRVASVRRPDPLPIPEMIEIGRASDCFVGAAG